MSRACLFDHGMDQAPLQFQPVVRLRLEIRNRMLTKELRRDFFPCRFAR